MSELNRMIAQYAVFETRVQRYIRNYFWPYCSTCADACCKPDFCQETLESIFLTFLREAYPPPASYSQENGWVSETGCILKIGRPPVCYEYLCDEIMAAQPTATYQYAVNVLSKLISHVGKRAHRGKHLVEILDRKEIAVVKFSYFENRLKEAETAFASVVSFHKNDNLSTLNWRDLEKILFSPKAVKMRIK
ncbi:MAG: hypothetical protein JSU83_03475 [Deltaproteobacteria bacterium]|nr:MAG: hypothetical protein JSU83_03475 [Deltaproteobacteria bacterium]